MALDWQTLQIGFGAGLNTKDDARFSSPPSLDIARDVQFEEIGGLQVRKPFVAMSNAILGGGTLANWRRLAVVNDELLVFTDESLYSWSPELGKWILRATHLGVAIDWREPYSTNGDQIGADRAELSGTAMHAWTEGGAVYVAAQSKATGAVILSPSAVSGATGQPRLVAADTAILLFFMGGSGLYALSFDPADPSAALAGSANIIDATTATGSYDVVRTGVGIVAGAYRRTTSTSYTVFRATLPLAITTTTKTRTCDGPIAITGVPGANRVHVFRTNGGAIHGDVMTNAAGFADVTVAQAIGTYSQYPGHLTACYRSIATATGHMVCAVFWTGGFDGAESIGSPVGAPWECKTNTVNEAGTIGTQSTFMPGLGIRSRAFDVLGSVFVQMIFAAGGPLNKIYLLYREDRTLHGTAVAQSAGDLEVGSVLPGVTADYVAGTTSLTYRWAASIRRVIGQESMFGSRSLVDITITFHSDDARRVAQIGLTGYLSGADILQYDGTRLVEVGWFALPSFASGGSGPTTAMAPGVYGYKPTYGYQNGRGEAERSTTIDYETTTVVTAMPEWTATPLYVTHKTASPPTVEIWRTVVNPPPDAPYYLASSIDPGATTNPNRYLVNSTAGIPAWRDNLVDGALTALAPNPENGDVLECITPPGASIVVATDTRLYLGGVSGDPDRVWASRERGDGEIVSFHEALAIDVPRRGGAMTAVWIMDDVLYVGRQYAIHAIPGAGYDNAGHGQGWGPAQTISLDVGPESQEAIALTPLGVLMKTGKGWYLLDHGRSLRYVGGPVNAYDGETVKAAHVVTAQHQVRILTGGRMLVWDYRGAVDAVTPDGLGQWAEWSIGAGLDAVMWRGTYVYLSLAGAYQESAALSGLTYALDVETSWIKPRELQGFGKLGAIMVLGEYVSACSVRIRLARDYRCDPEGDPIYFDDRAWPPSPAVSLAAWLDGGGGLRIGDPSMPMQVRHVPSAGNSNVEAIKVRITAVTEERRADLETGGLNGLKSRRGSSLASQFDMTSGVDFSATWVWDSLWQATATHPGEMGNEIWMSLSFRIDDTAATAIVVRDHFTFDPLVLGGRWREHANNVGVLVSAQSGASVTIAALQAAIAGATSLLTMITGDPLGGSVVPVAALVGYSPVTQKSGAGVWGIPTGAGFKLTGLALEVGLHRGLYKRLPAAQKQ